MSTLRKCIDREVLHKAICLQAHNKVFKKKKKIRILTSIQTHIRMTNSCLSSSIRSTLKFVVVKVRHTGVRFDGAGAYYLPTESTTQCQWEGGRRGPIVIGKGRPARLLSMIDDESRGDGKIQVAEALGFGKAHRHHRYGR